MMHSNGFLTFSAHTWHLMTFGGTQWDKRGKKSIDFYYLSLSKN